MHEIKSITMTPEILKLIAEIDEFKGAGRSLRLAPEKLQSATDCHDWKRGVIHAHRRRKLSDAEVEKLLSGLRKESFAGRDEQEVACYADAMDMIFDGYESITATENAIASGDMAYEHGTMDMSYDEDGKSRSFKAVILQVCKSNGNVCESVAGTMQPLEQNER